MIPRRRHLTPEDFGALLYETVREAVAAFVDGRLNLVTQPNAQGHW